MSRAYGGRDKAGARRRTDVAFYSVQDEGSEELPDADVPVDIVIEHYGDALSLGWTLGGRHVWMAAAVGGALSVDEHDHTAGKSTWFARRMP